MQLEEFKIIMGSCLRKCFYTPKTFKDMSLISKRWQISGSVFEHIPKTLKDMSLLSKQGHVSGSVFENTPKTLKDMSLISKRGHISGSVCQNISTTFRKYIYDIYVTPRLSPHAGRSCQRVRSARPRGQISCPKVFYGCFLGAHFDPNISFWCTSWKAIEIWRLTQKWERWGIHPPPI